MREIIGILQSAVAGGGGEGKSGKRYCDTTAIHLPLPPHPWEKIMTDP